MYYLLPGKVIHLVLRGDPPTDALWSGEDLSLAPPELLPVTEPEPDWEAFKAEIRPNTEFLALVDSSGAAARLADAIEREDLAAAKDYWQFLKSQNRISPTLEAAISSAAAQHGLVEQFLEVSSSDAAT